MREAYRLSKASLQDLDRVGQLEIMVIFVGKKMVEYDVIAKAMEKVVGKISD